jgi:hypothetical protein
VAVKIQKSAPHYLEAAFDEVEILQKVAKNVKNPEWLKSLQKYKVNCLFSPYKLSPVKVASHAMTPRLCSFSTLSFTKGPTATISALFSKF